MGNRNHRSTFEDGTEGAFEVARRSRVEQCRGFIQHEGVRVGQDEAGQRHLLGLGRSDRMAGRSKLRVESFGELLDPFQRL
jgi:hypothetical protein